ncbi:peptidyl-prolyl cis-trans isomerase [Aureimonas mangrovi]|uniref:peptidyl-prolyl cis-trans isomerase n=1 Tax=Aureimonas mangrovi TaxID=2758041 RepID=UPI00163D7D36|nr:peptidyl-prolyl cis-trans isomerase [Aureimonas mangrovi]
MMDVLRRSISGWVGKVVLGLMLGIFAVAWTIADGFSGRTSPNTVLTAGGTTVTLQDYQLAYQQSLASVAQQLQRRPTPEEAQAFGVDQNALSQLATGAVLDEQGRLLGLGLSESGLLRLIAEDPSFQDGSGNFSRTAFSNVMRSAGLTEAAYLERLGDTALRTQLIDAVADGVGAPRVLAAAIGLYAGERRTVSYVNLQPQDATALPDPSADELEDFFMSRGSTYAAPEYRSFSYVDLTPQSAADTSAITDEEIAADYEASQQRFTTPERRRIQQIVFPDQAAAEAASSELQGGADFDAVAQSTGRSVVDLGLQARDEIADGAIADAAFALDQGAVSAPVAGVFGPAILRVTEIVPQSVQPLDEVRDQLREELALDAADERVSDAYNAFEDARASGATLDEAAAQAGLTSVTVDNVAADGSVAEGEAPVLPAAAQLLAGVFDTEPGFDNPPINYGSNSFLFYDVNEIVPARDRPLDEVRDEVVADWKEDEAQRLLEERANALRERVEGGEALEAVAEAEGLEVQLAAAITRSTGMGPLGEAALRTAFSGPSGLIAVAPSAAPGGWTLLRVDEVAPPADPMSSVPQGQDTQLIGALRNDILQSYVELLQQEIPVSYNAAAVQAAQGQLP